MVERMRTTRSSAALLAALLTGAAAPADTKIETLTLEVAEDAWMQDENGDSRDEHLGTLAALAIGGRWEHTRFRGLFRFDLSSIPVNAAVTGAALSLYHQRNRIEGANVNVLSVYECLRDWHEAEVTWNQYDAGKPWSMPGAEDLGVDRADELLSRVTFDPATPATQYIDFDVTEAFEGTPSTWPAFGFIITGTETGPLADRYFTQFAPKEANTYPALLNLTYEVTTFLRSDTNADGVVDISDAIHVLSYLFVGGKGISCLRSADADDDGVLDITDPIIVLDHLFLGAAAPASPYPACGLDETEDSLGCVSYASCR